MVVLIRSSIHFRTFIMGYFSVCFSMLISIMIDFGNPPWQFNLVLLRRDGHLSFIINTIYQYMLCIDIILIALIVEISFILLTVFVVHRLLFMDQMLAIAKSPKTRVLDRSWRCLVLSRNRSFNFLKTFVVMHRDVIQ